MAAYQQQDDQSALQVTSVAQWHKCRGEAVAAVIAVARMGFVEDPRDVDGFLAGVLSRWPPTSAVWSASWPAGPDRGKPISWSEW